MLEKLRWKFVAMTMGIVGVVLAMTLGMSYWSNYSAQHRFTHETLEYALTSEPGIGIGGRATKGYLPYLTVDVSPSGSVLERATGSIDVDSDVLLDVVNEAVVSEASYGESPTHGIAWASSTTEYGRRIVMCNTFQRDALLAGQLASTLLIFAAAMGGLFLVVLALSRWALSPVELAWEQQRRFVSDASHELKTPLAVILANTQILGDSATLPDEDRRWVAGTAEEAAHMKELVDDLLTLARADEQAAVGASGAPVGDVDLSSLVEGCALEFDPVAFERGCSIEADVEGNIMVGGNQTQLDRAVRTLVDNATKYAEKGSCVCISLKRREGHPTIAVSNQGDPISHEDLEHIFDRFYRTDSARERQEHGGFGLGLAIAKSIVEAHGGTIGASSTPEGLITFSIRL